MEAILADLVKYLAQNPDKVDEAISLIEHLITVIKNKKS